MVFLAEHLASASFTQHRATSQRQISPHTVLHSHDSHLTLALRYATHQIGGTSTLDLTDRLVSYQLHSSINHDPTCLCGSTMLPKGL